MERVDSGPVQVLVVGADAVACRDALAGRDGMAVRVADSLATVAEDERVDCLVVGAGVDVTEADEQRRSVADRLPTVLWLDDVGGVPVSVVEDPFVSIVPRDAGGALLAGEIRGLAAHRREVAGYERNERALDYAPVGITVSDPDLPDNPVVYANDGFTRLTGYPIEEVEGRNCRFLQGPDTDEGTLSTLREAIDDERRVEVDLLNYRKDGTPFWNHLEVAPVYEDGDLVNYVGYQKDVTDRVEKTRQLEETNQRLEAVSGVMSHDIRNPLSVAKGHVEMGRAGDADWTAIEGALDRIEAIVEDALVLARAEDPDRDPVDLSAVAWDAWRTAVVSGMDLTVDAKRTIVADGGLVVQLLENLYRNATEHGAAGSLTVGLLDDGFYVADDGGGIPVDDRETVFEPGVSTGPDGTGLGLYIVKRVADIHGWSVTLTEGVEGGARFEFTGVETF